MKKTTFTRFAACFFAALLFVLYVPTVPEKTYAATAKSRFSKNYTLTGNGASDMVAIAWAQVGKTECDFHYGEAWCADFVSDCAELAGQSEAIPRDCSVAGMKKRIKGSKVSSPQPGDIVIWQNASISHVEIVTSVKDGVAYSIGGNNGGHPKHDGCRGGQCTGERRCNAIGVVDCYIRPHYKGTPDPPPPSPELAVPYISTDKSSYEVGDTVKVSWTASPAASDIDHYWLNVINPDGTWTYGGTMYMDTSYSFTAYQAGEYSVTAYATPKGSRNGEGSLENTKIIKVNKLEPESHASATNVTVDMDKNETKQIEFSYANYSGSVTISYERLGTAITNLSWGEWSGQKCKLNISGDRTGSEKILVTLMDKSSGYVIGEYTINIVVTGTFKITVDKPNLEFDLDKGTKNEIYATFTNMPSEGTVDIVDENGYSIDGSNGIIKGTSTIYDKTKKIYKISLSPVRLGKSTYYFQYTNSKGKKSNVGSFNAVVYRYTTVTFDPGEDAELSTKKLTFRSDKKVTASDLPMPVRKGYNFCGWYGMLWSESVLNLEKDATLKAKWRKSAPVVIDLKVNGQSEYTAEPGEEITVTYEITGSEGGYATLGQKMLYGEYLSFKSFKAGPAINNLIVTHSENETTSPRQCYFLTAGSHDLGTDGVACTIKMKVDENTPIGTEMQLVTAFEQCSAFYSADEGKYLNYTINNCSLLVKNKAVAGDVNEDGKVSVADAVALQKWLLGSPSELSSFESADLCQDGVIDSFDMVMLRKLLIKK